MKFIVEMTGPIVAPEPRYWSAYSETAGALGLPRVDESRFWQLVRSGAEPAQWLRGAKPTQIREFQEQFDEALETDENIALQTPHEGVAEALSGLRKHGECVLITDGANRLARQLLLDRLDLSVHFTAMRGLPQEVHARVRTLKDLCDGDDRVVVVAGSGGVVRVAQQAELVVVGMTNGAFSSACLARMGAHPLFDSLGELVAEMESGAQKLIQAGLLPIRFQVNRNPFVTPDHAYSARSRSNGYRRDRRR